MPSGLISTRVLVVAGACLATLLGSFALSRPDSKAEGVESLPKPARVLGTVAPASLPGLGEASKLPAIERKAPARKVKRQPAPAPVSPARAPAPEPVEPVEPVEPELQPAPVPVAPAPVAPPPAVPSPPVSAPEPAPPEPAPEPSPVYLDDSG